MPAVALPEAAVERLAPPLRQAGAALRAAPQRVAAGAQEVAPRRAEAEAREVALRRAAEEARGAVPRPVEVEARPAPRQRAGAAARGAVPRPAEVEAAMPVPPQEAEAARAALPRRAAAVRRARRRQAAAVARQADRPAVAARPQAAGTPGPPDTVAGHRSGRGSGPLAEGRSRPRPGCSRQAAGSCSRGVALSNSWENSFDQAPSVVLATRVARPRSRIQSAIRAAIWPGMEIPGGTVSWRFSRRTGRKPSFW